MGSLNIIEINTLNEYISIIKEANLSEYYFRGENKKYPTISSSLLRKDTSLLLKNDNFSFYEDVVNYYYSEIASNIGELERENFLAFSQHHGLTTNLIDFSTSPLVALYFACATSDKILEDNKGFVYLINKENTIDISRMINEECEPPATSYNLIEMFRTTTKNFKTFSKYLNEFFYINGYEPYKNNLINQSLHLSTITDRFGHDFLEEYVKIFRDDTSKTDEADELDKIYGDLHILISEYLSKFDVKAEGVPFNTWIYIILLLEFFSTLSSMSFFNYNKEATIEFPKMPYFIYKTPYKFDRIRNQDGIFLYQLYHTYATENEDKANAILRQKIIPDITLVINNQKRILEELDFIGINLKSIYGDFDNTASYINNKFF